MSRKVTFNQAWTGQADCLNCAIRSSALFNGLTQEDFDQMHQPVDQMLMRQGDVLYHVGEKGRHLYTIRTGLVKLVQYMPDGTQRIVRLESSTDVLGLELLVEENYAHEAIALRPTELCRYPVSAVEKLSQTNPVLHRDLMGRWQKALKSADEWLTQLSTGPAKKRLASLFLKLVDENGECYLLSREDVGSILSLTTETASRMVSELKRNAVIEELSKNHFSIDTGALEAIVAE
jgi:CRP-like cAMP-binding protein